jgi:hypothetical protein
MIQQEFKVKNLFYDSRLSEIFKLAILNHYNSKLNHWIARSIVKTIILMFTGQSSSWWYYGHYCIDWKSFFHNRNRWIFYISCFYSIVCSEMLAHLHSYVMSTFAITNDVDINHFPHSNMDDRDVVCYLWISIQNYMWSYK